MNLHLSFPVRSISRGIRDHDEPSGRRPEVLERTRQPLRMSKLSSASHSGREIRCFEVLRSTWVFQTIFNHFWAPFILFYNTVWANQTFVLLFFEGWTAGAIFFQRKLMWTLSCVCGWQRRKRIGKYKCLCFPSKLLSHYTCSEELFDFKKGKLDEFPYKPRHVNKGHCIVLHLPREFVFWMATPGKNPWLFMFSFKAFEL